MANENTAEYGPLRHLFGTWRGDKGINVSPEPNGSETDHYYEIITFEKGGDVKNAETQRLSIARYHLAVYRKSNNEIFHDQVGYWIWDKENETIIHSLTIGRAVSILAGGHFDLANANDDEITFHVTAEAGGEWGIIQSPFMIRNAKTTAFTMLMTVNKQKLIYSETLIIDIYGRTVEHTDKNELIKML